MLTAIEAKKLADDAMSKTDRPVVASALKRINYAIEVEAKGGRDGVEVSIDDGSLTENFARAIQNRLEFLGYNVRVGWNENVTRFHILW